MVKKIPNRLCTEKTSPFFDARYMGVTVKLNGEEQKDVIEYYLVGGWIRRIKRDKNGKVMSNMLRTGAAIEKIHGNIEVSWKNASQ